MTNATQPKSSGGIVGKWNTLGAFLLRDSRCRIIHAKVFWVLLERFWEKHGNARASVGFLEAATGLTRGSVATATADLVAWGYFTRIMGSGKRPTPRP